MSKPLSDLQLAVQAVRSSTQPVRIDSSYLTLTFPHGHQVDLVEDLRNSGIWSREINDSGLIEISKPPLFFSNIDELIVKPQWRRAAPSNEFYLLDADWMSTEENTPAIVESWKSASKLLNLLASVADHCVKKANDIEIVFLYQEKLVLTSSYSSSDLVPLVDLDVFQEEYLDSGNHRDKKIQIFKSVVTEKYKGRGRVDYGEFLNDFSKLYNGLVNGYELFVSEFSFQKVKSEVERDKLEFTTRLNRVFSDIQNQLLAVPAALLLVGSQMERLEPADWYIKNIVIWLGAVVFSILMELLIRNQRNTLQAVKNEMNLQEVIFKEHHMAVFDKFSDVYVELGDRFLHQRNLLWFIRFLVCCALGFTTSMLLDYSTEMQLSNSIVLGVFVGLIPIFIAILSSDLKFLRRTKK